MSVNGSFFHFPFLYSKLTRKRCRIEATSYFLANSPAPLEHAQEFEQAMDHLVGLIERAQQDDGYLNIYFTVVDPEGRFKNFRDMHEMCEFDLVL